MKTLFKKSALAVLAINLAAPVALSTSTNAQAGSRDAFVGGLVGGVVGGVIGSSHCRRSPDVVYVEPRRVYREPAYVGHGSPHIRWCLNHYRSYVIRTNTYTAFSGRVKYCHSPYAY